MLLGKIKEKKPIYALIGFLAVFGLLGLIEIDEYFFKKKCQDIIYNDSIKSAIITINLDGTDYTGTIMNIKKNIEITNQSTITFIDNMLKKAKSPGRKERGFYDYNLKIYVTTEEEKKYSLELFGNFKEELINYIFYTKGGNTTFYFYDNDYFWDDFIEKNIKS